jgi:hypothetical protein
VIELQALILYDSSNIFEYSLREDMRSYHSVGMEFAIPQPLTSVVQQLIHCSLRVVVSFKSVATPLFLFSSAKAKCENRKLQTVYANSIEAMLEKITLFILSSVSLLMPCSFSPFHSSFF